MIVAPVAAFVVPICPAWCGAGWLWRVLALAVVLWCCGVGCLPVLMVLCCVALPSVLAVPVWLVWRCCVGCLLVLVVLAVDFAGMAFGSCMGLGGTIGGRK